MNAYDARNILAPVDSSTKVWIGIIQQFMAAGWSQSLTCPFCGNCDLTLRDIKAVLRRMFVAGFFAKIAPNAFQYHWPPASRTNFPHIRLGGP
jgi:hypothetical protein